MLQLMLGLRYIHGDIKPDNILISNKNIIKYIDFGASCVKTCKRTFYINVCQAQTPTVHITRIFQRHNVEFTGNCSSSRLSAGSNSIIPTG